MKLIRPCSGFVSTQEKSDTPDKWAPRHCRSPVECSRPFEDKIRRRRRDTRSRLKNVMLSEIKRLDESAQILRIVPRVHRHLDRRC